MATTARVQPRQRLTAGQRAQASETLARRYADGRSIRQLCAETGYSIGRVRRLLADVGVEFRSRGGSNRRRDS